jgi:hypothetical protein
MAEEGVCIIETLSHLQKEQTMRRILSLLGAFVSLLSAQTEVFGLRTYAADDEYRPPVIQKNEYVTIEFDVTTDLPPNLNIIFRHASRDWVIDRNTFVNYEPKLRSEALFYTAAPNGVVHYTYHFKNSFPNKRSFVEFTYSGNYLYSVVDRDAGDKVIAEGRFIIAESAVPVTMKIENKYHTEYTSPLNQRNLFTLNISAPSDYTAADDLAIDHTGIRRIDIIKNWEFERPLTIDADDRNGETFVEYITMPSKIFTKRDAAPGNEYRRLDISSPQFYPNNLPVLVRDQPDVSRFQWQGKPDANGASKLNAFTGANSDYLEVEMRLRLAQPPAKRIFVTGGFTEWNVLPEYEMVRDSSDGLYRSQFWLRRGVYDYQYVLGEVDANGKVTEQDWLTLEGNDWRTINRYIAVLYYQDRRYGGFDRVVGVVRGRNPGTSEHGKSSSSVSSSTESQIQSQPIKNIPPVKR